MNNRKRIVGVLGVMSALVGLTVAFADTAVAPSPNCPTGQSLHAVYSARYAEYNAYYATSKKAYFDWVAATVDADKAKAAYDAALAKKNIANTRLNEANAENKRLHERYIAAGIPWKAHASSCTAKTKCVYQSLGK